MHRGTRLEKDAPRHHHRLVASARSLWEVFPIQPLVLGLHTAWARSRHPMAGQGCPRLAQPLPAAGTSRSSRSAKPRLPTALLVSSFLVENTASAKVVFSPQDSSGFLPQAKPQARSAEPEQFQVSLR